MHADAVGAGPARAHAQVARTRRRDYPGLGQQAASASGNTVWSQVGGSKTSADRLVGSDPAALAKFDVVAGERVAAAAGEFGLAWGQDAWEDRAGRIADAFAGPVAVAGEEAAALVAAVGDLTVRTAEWVIGLPALVLVLGELASSVEVAVFAEAMTAGTSQIHC